MERSFRKDLCVKYSTGIYSVFQYLTPCLVKNVLHPDSTQEHQLGNHFYSLLSVEQDSSYPSASFHMTYLICQYLAIQSPNTICSLSLYTAVCRSEVYVRGQSLLRCAHVHTITRPGAHEFSLNVTVVHREHHKACIPVSYVFAVDGGGNVKPLRNLFQVLSLIWPEELCSAERGDKIGEATNMCAEMDMTLLDCKTDIRIKL